MNSKNYILVAIFALISMFAAPIQAQNLIVDGSFENIANVGGIANYHAMGDLTFAWDVTIGSVHVSDTANVYTHGDAFDGTQFMDLDGWPPGPGQIDQTIETTPGTSYIFSFAYANNYANHSVSLGQVSVLDSSNLFLIQTLSHSTSVSGNLNWTPYSFEFTALENSTKFEFTSFSRFDSLGGLLIDGVSVIPTSSLPVPEPSGLMLVGLTIALTAFRRRR